MWAMPKSITFNWQSSAPVGKSMILPGLRSPWMIPFAWAWARAMAILAVMLRACCSSSLTDFSKVAARVRPSTYSMTMNGSFEGSSKPLSRIQTRDGCCTVFGAPSFPSSGPASLSLALAALSCLSRPAALSSTTSLGKSTFRATVRPSPILSALYTALRVPLEMRSLIR